MSFSSLTFVIFFATVLAGMLVAQKCNVTVLYKHLILLAASYIFYGWWDWRFCSLMLAMTAIAHLSSIRKEKKIWRVIGVVFPLIILGIFKYCNFFVDSFCAAFGIKQAGSLGILLPVGISFFTFQKTRHHGSPFCVA